MPWVAPSRKARSSRTHSRPKQQSNKKPAAPSQAAETSTPSPAAPSEAEIELQREQQRLLNLFANSFDSVISSDNFSTILQEVKQALFNRDFAAAFGREDYLEAYAARWSPTRALCYAAIFSGIKEHLDEILVLEEGDPGTDILDSTSSTQVGLTQEAPTESDKDKPPEDSAAEKESNEAVRPSTRSTLKMLSVGGCAAEHVAFASYLRETSGSGHLSLLDSAPWATSTSLLQSNITQPPPISKYSSAAVRAANHALLEPGQLEIAVAEQDVLALDEASLSAWCANGKNPVVLTLLFTLNELYTGGGISKTTKFLKNLGRALAPGSLVLVVDSPGSYSEAALGKEKKRYPMQWLLDHTLIETETPDYSWEKLESDESIWFRLPEALSYPIPLENMRYQMHLYRLEKST
ncbi:hypothetical protein FZEAL_4932 [Fusarium zealandicum]|uniref:25S rRNA (Uridine(2843)-N(3))-methyltransferase n=1 Tax=Fusarium zealandicum TaxID=1053134 RepID=A0A8H4XKY4_9HYPO|nr:hypothetical protein FZEAL_4932 [Fusarium zealandicum]